MSEPFLGQVMMFAGNFAPRGWALCDGQLLNISEYSALFSILGTTYGGDGRTTFGLPEMRGRSPIHKGNGPGLADVRLGAKGGNASVTLQTINMPSHTHNATVDNQLRVGATTGSNNHDDPDDAVLAAGPNNFREADADTSMRASSIRGTLAVTNAAAGGGQAFNNRNPYIAVNYIIALTGVFPSRS